MLQVVIDITAVPLRTLRDVAGNGILANTIGSIVIGRQGQVQIAVIAVQQFPDIFGPGKNI